MAKREDIKPGSKVVVWWLSETEICTVTKLRKDDRGVLLIDVKSDKDGAEYVTRIFELFPR